jgi:hypothetical protein
MAQSPARPCHSRSFAPSGRPGLVGLNLSTLPNRRNLIDDRGTLFGFILPIAEQFGWVQPNKRQERIDLDELRN